MNDYHARGLALALCTLLLAGCSDESSLTRPSADETGPGDATFAAAMAGSWTARAPMPTPRYYHATAVAKNASGQHIVYVFGGVDRNDPEGPATNFVDAYNPATNSWTSKSRWESAQAGVNGVGVIGGRFYFPGGGSETGNGFEMNKQLHVYNPNSDTWTRKADMPQESSDGVSGVINGKLYVLTGWDNFQDGCPDCGRRISTKRLFRYDPVTNRWVGRRSSPNYHVRGAAGAINGKLYVAGGVDASGESAKLDIYDPVSDSWSSGPPMPAPRSSVTGVVHARRLYVIGGGNGEVTSFDPATNRWTVEPPLPTPRRLLAATSYNSPEGWRIIALGGLSSDDSGPEEELATARANEVYRR